MNTTANYHITTLPPTADFQFADWNAATHAARTLDDAGYQVNHNIDTAIPGQWSPATAAAPMPEPIQPTVDLVFDPTFNRDEARFVELAKNHPAKLDIVDRVLATPPADPSFDKDETRIRALTEQQLTVLAKGLQIFEDRRTGARQ